MVEMLHTVYVEETMCQSDVTEWLYKFNSGCESLEDDLHSQPSATS